MDKINILFDTIFLNNSYKDYLIFIISMVLGFILKGLLSKYLSHSLYKLIGSQKNKVGIEKFDKLLSKPLSFFIILSILYLASSHLNYPTDWNLVSADNFGIKMIVFKSYSFLYILSIFWIIIQFIEYIGLILLKKAEETESKVDDQLIPFALEIIKFIVYVFAICIILSNVFAVNVVAVTAGLGIGGIALAMASKESLENLLGSFTIFLDRPFTVGDTVTVGSITGIVEKVGFRSTRIRTFDRSLVTLPNKKMIDAELDNLGMRPVRRVKFYIGLTYETSINQIKNIVKDIQDIIDTHTKTNNEGKVKFQEFGASSLDVLVVYYVNSPSWTDLIDTKEDINFKIMEIVKNNNSEFAFPSTTVYLEK